MHRTASLSTFASTVCQTIPYHPIGLLNRLVRWLLSCQIPHGGAL